MRAGPSGVQTLVQEGLNDPWGIALNVPMVPMAGTGFVRSAPASGFDSFAHVFEAVPGTKAVGRIGTSLGALKDVDVDLTTGLIYAIDFLPGGFGQQVYVIDPATGAGTPLPNPTGLPAPALIWGLAFDAGGTLYGGGLGVYRIDKSTGRASLLADVGRHHPSPDCGEPPTGAGDRAGVDSRSSGSGGQGQDRSDPGGPGHSGCQVRSGPRSPGGAAEHVRRGDDQRRSPGRAAAGSGADDPAPPSR
jgi:hypothetical protein